MTGVNPVDFVRLARKKVERLRPPAGPTRRSSVRDLDRVIEVTRDDLIWLDQQLTDDDERFWSRFGAARCRVLEVTSMLYAAGAEHSTWRDWASLAAFGLLIGDDADPVEAAQYARLAGEWALAAELPELKAPDEGPRVREVWQGYALAVADRNAVAVTSALHQIADAHVDRYGPGWQRFVEWDYPLFDPLAGAAAATGRHLGLVLFERLSEEDRRYLDQGLAEGEPPARFPASWPEPSVVARR